MRRTRPPFPTEFREQMVELVREFEPSEGSIREWVKQADLDEGRRDDGLTTDDQEKLRLLRRVNR